MKIHQAMADVPTFFARIILLSGIAGLLVPTLASRSYAEVIFTGDTRERLTLFQTEAMDQGDTGTAGRIHIIVNSSVMTALFDGIASTLQFGNAISQTSPLLTGNSQLATQNALDNFNHVIQDRLNGNRGMSSGDGFSADRHLWVRPFGSWANQDNQDGVSGYTADTIGFAAGIDGMLSSALRLGGALGYAKVKVDSQSSAAPQSLDVDVYQLIGYGRYSLDSRTGIDFRAHAGLNTNQGSRQIAFTSTVASSSYDSQDFQLGASINRTYALGEKTNVIPSLRIDYTWINDDSYSETGAGLLNLNVNSRSTDALVVGADARVIHALSEGISLMGDLGVGYDTINKQASITSTFAGSPDATFVTYGIDPGPWLARGGFGFICKSGDGVEVSARYDAFFREGFLSQTASVQLSWAL